MVNMVIKKLSRNNISIVFILQNIKKILLDIAKEEKTHVGEFQALLLKLDKEQSNELEEGKKEVDELTS